MFLTDKERDIVKGALDTAQLMDDLFRRCLDAKYTHVDNDGDFAVEVKGDILILLFQQTHSVTDWISNFDFAAKPYKDMEVKWRCHRGFLRVWKSIEPHIESYVKDPKYKQIYIAGYSHGAAIATLAHEYCWFWRPDLRQNGLMGFGFGCPRCYFGWHMKKKLRERWKTFFPVRNLNDIVTHVPPVLFGFRHVNHVVKIGSGYYTKDPKHPKRFKCVLAHYDNNYLYSLNEIINRLSLMYYTCLHFFDFTSKL